LFFDERARDTGEALSPKRAATARCLLRVCAFFGAHSPSREAGAAQHNPEKKTTPKKQTVNTARFFNTVLFLTILIIIQK
jgi:hypothetical protein